MRATAHHPPHFRQLFLLVSLTLLIWVASGSVGVAHSILISSDPPANTTLAIPPRLVRLLFTEPIDPSFSSITIVDAQGDRVSHEVQVLQGDREMMTSADAAVHGIFTVKWHVLSAVDGHPTAGFLVFAVGQPAPTGLSNAAGEPPASRVIVARWISFLAGLFLVGSTVFPLAVVRPGLRGLSPQEASAMRTDLAARLYGLQAGAGILLLASIALEFNFTAMTVFDASLSTVAHRGLLWPLLAGTRAGWSVLIRMPLALLLLLPPTRLGQIVQSIGLMFFIGVTGLAVLFRGPAAVASPGHAAHLTVLIGVTSVYGLIQAVRRPPEVTWMPVLAAAGILTGMTLTAHASGSGGLAIVADWAHMVAAAVWIGGLASLFVVLWTARPLDRRHLVRVCVPQFAVLAGVSLGVLVLTGAYSAWIQVSSLAAFVSTKYGQALLVKLLLVLPLAMLGAVNHFVLHPRLLSQRGAIQTRAQQRFRIVVGAEVVLAAVVLVATAVLTQVPPARVALSATSRALAARLVLAGMADDVKVRLAIVPSLPASNSFEATVTDHTGRPLSQDAHVMLRFTKLDEDLTPTNVSLTSQGQNRYQAESGELRIPGWWAVDVIVRRGRLNAIVRFPLRFGERSGAATPAAQRLLEQASAALASVRMWREQVELTDGAGNFVTTEYTLVRPDRLRYRTSSGNEAIIIGKTRYSRADSGTWVQDTLATPLIVEGPFLQYMTGASRVTGGREEACDEERCRVVLWTTDPSTAFAAWIGLRTHRVQQLLMVAPSHYMVTRVKDTNAALQITPPR